MERYTLSPGRITPRLQHDSGSPARAPLLRVRENVTRSPLIGSPASDGRISPRLQHDSGSPARAPLLRVRENVNRSPLIGSPASDATYRFFAELGSHLSEGSTRILCAKASERWNRWGGLRSSWLVKNSFDGWRSLHPMRHWPKRCSTDKFIFECEGETNEQRESRVLKSEIDVNAIVSAVTEGLRIGPLKDMQIELQNIGSQIVQIKQELGAELRETSVRMSDTAKDVADVREVIVNIGVSGESAHICGTVEQRSLELQAFVERRNQDLLTSLQEKHDILLSRVLQSPATPVIDNIVQVGGIADIEQRLSELKRAIDGIRIPNITSLHTALEQSSGSLQCAIKESTQCLLQAHETSKISERLSPLLEAMEVSRLEQFRDLIHKVEINGRSNNEEVLRAIRTLSRDSSETSEIKDEIQNALDSHQRKVIATVHSVRDDLRSKFDSLDFKVQHSELLQAIRKGSDVIYDKHSIALEQVVSQVRLASEGFSRHTPRLKAEDKDVGILVAVEKCQSAILDVLVLVRSIADVSDDQNLLKIQDALQSMRHDTVKDVVERLEVAVDHSPLLEAIGSFELKGHSEVLSSLKQIQCDLNMEPDFSPVLLALRDLPSAEQLSQVLSSVQKVHMEYSSVHAAINAGTGKVLRALEAIFGARAMPQERSTSPHRKFLVTLGAEPAVSPLRSPVL